MYLRREWLSCYKKSNDPTDNIKLNSHNKTKIMWSIKPSEIRQQQSTWR